MSGRSQLLSHGHGERRRRRPREVARSTTSARRRSARRVRCARRDGPASTRSRRANASAGIGSVCRASARRRRTARPVGVEGIGASRCPRSRSWAVHLRLGRWGEGRPRGGASPPRGVHQRGWSPVGTGRRPGSLGRAPGRLPGRPAAAAAGPGRGNSGSSPCPGRSPSIAAASSTEYPSMSTSTSARAARGLIDARRSARRTPLVTAASAGSSGPDRRGSSAASGRAARRGRRARGRRADLAAADPVEAGVHHDPVQPGGDRGVAAEGVGPAERRDHRVLQRVGGLLRVADGPATAHNRSRCRANRVPNASGSPSRCAATRPGRRGRQVGTSRSRADGDLGHLAG